jgi:hypothetical protein
MARLGEMSEVVEQYRYLKNKKLRYTQILKELIALENNNLEYDKVRLLNQIIHKPDSYDTDNTQLFKLVEAYKRNRSQRSPALAGVLSAFFPGAGQFYNGAYQSAVISLLLNSIFLWSTLEFNNRDLNGPALASGVVFSVTYLGNIMNAVRGSNKLNEMSSAKDKENLKELLFPLLRIQF